MGDFARAIHRLATNKGLLGLSVVSGAIFLLNLGGVPGDISQWARWLHWMKDHRTHVTFFVGSATVWMIVTTWLIIGLNRDHHGSPARAGEPNESPRPTRESGPLVIATQSDAVKAKLLKWIRRANEIEASFIDISPFTKTEGASPEDLKSHLVALDVIQNNERSTIHNWHLRVVDELRAIGGGALGLYSANEAVSYALFGALHENRKFLGERRDELKAILSRIDPQAAASFRPAFVPPPNITPYGINESDPVFQLRQTLLGVRPILVLQRRILSDRKLIASEFDRTKRGPWHDAGQSAFLAQHGLDDAYSAIEDAFVAIGLLDPATVYNDVRLEAIEKIDVALDEISNALKRLTGASQQ
jgi:hypothetical protein